MELPTLPSIERPTWVNIISPIEFKVNSSNTREGMGQTISYVSITLLQQVIFGREKSVGVYSNWESITVLGFWKSQSYETNNLPLFSAVRQQPTEGFEYLCRVLNSPRFSLGYFGLPEKVIVGRNTYTVDGFLSQGANSVVYRCTAAVNDGVNENYAVKIPNIQPRQLTSQFKWRQS